MGVIETLLLVIHQAVEHGAVAHMVAIEDAMPVCEIIGIPAVQEDAASGVVLACKQVAEIILVVSPLHHGVVDIGAVNDKPTNHIGIDRPQRVKIY